MSAAIHVLDHRQSELGNRQGRSLLHHLGIVLLSVSRLPNCKCGSYIFSAIYAHHL